VEDEMGGAHYDAEWLTRMPQELIRAAFEGRDPLSAFPDRLLPYVPDELRAHLAEFGELASLTT
jgi:hypothetical protein